MFVLDLFSTEHMYTAALAAERLCAAYWVGFNAIDSKQDPNQMASFYKESGHK